MIKYSLRCGSGCGFEGWFRSSADFEAQAENGDLSCPLCGDAQVERAIMAPAVVGSPKRGAAQADAETPASPPAVAASPPPGPAANPRGAVFAALRQLRLAVEANADNVGTAFADEAMKMHEGEIPERPIYGDATPEENDRLEDAGVAVKRIPWAPLEDA